MAQKDLDIDIAGILSQEDETGKTDGESIRDLYAQPPSQKARGNILASQTMILQGQDGNPQQYPVLAQDTDKETTHAQAVQDKSAAVEENARRTLAATLETDSESFEATAQAVQERLAENKSFSEDALAPERHLADAITSNAPIKIDDLVKEQEVVRQAVLNDVAKILSDQSTLDKVMDFSGFLVPFGFAKDQLDIMDAKFDWTNATNIERFVMDFQGLPAERKLKELPAITDAILQATGTNILGMEASESNVIKAASILISLVSAEGADEQAFQRDLDIVFGMIDAGGPALLALKGVMGTATQVLAKTNNPVKKIKNLGDTKRAAQLDIYAMDPTIEAELAEGLSGLNKQMAYTNAMPISRDSLRPEWTPDLAPEVSRQLNELERKADGIVHSFLDDSVFIKEGLLRTSEKETVIRNTLDKLVGKSEGSDVLNEGIHIDNIQVSKVDEQGFTIDYDMRVMGELEESISKRHTWSRDDVTGNFRETVKHALPGFDNAVSPSAWSYTGPDGDFLASFKSASNLADIAAGAQSQILDLLKAANKIESGHLSPKGRQKVNLVEIAGDEVIDKPTGIRGKTYSPDELISGVQTPEGTVRLTSPAEQEAYYKHRIFADSMAQLENHAASRQLDILGFTKEATLGGKEKVLVKPFSEAGAAKTSIRGKTGFHFWDGRTGQSVALSDDAIDELYSDGFILARTMDDAPVSGEDNIVEYFDYVAVRTGDLSPRPSKVIHMKEGYVPKINKRVEYLVKEHVPRLKHGAADATRAVTHRFFASKADAEKHREKLIARYLADNVDVTLKQAKERFSAVADREMTPLQKLKESSGSSGGLYTGQRSSDNIVSGLRGIDTPRLSPLEAFQRNAQHIGSLMARNEWRLGEEQRWLNTIESYGYENRGFSGTKLGTDRISKALEEERRLINVWSGIPTAEESFFEGVMQNMHDWALTVGRRVPGLSKKESVPAILWTKHINPAAAFKSATMTLTLGVWNPAQLFVQGSAAAVALSRFPKTAHTSLGYAFRLAATDRMKGAGTAERVAKLWGDETTPLFSEVRLAWERSGLRESVRQNADLNAADSYGAMSMNSIKRLSDANMVFYRTGELFNRRVSFTSSYLGWKRLNPGKIPTEDQLKAIKADANLSMLELNHANRAMWQGGPDAGTFRNILGVMTQFQQVGAKSTELLIKGQHRGGFSSPEKMRIMLAQFGLWGAAGIPLGNALVREAEDWLGAEMTPETRERWNQGLLGAMVVHNFGAEVEVAPRLAPFGQLEQLVRDLMFDDVPLAERMFGVAGSIGGRFGDAFSQLKPMLTASFDRDSFTKEDILMGATIIGQIPSSSRGVLKAHIMRNQHKIVDRHKNVIVPQDFNWQTELGAALGFRPIEEVEVRETQLGNLDSSELVQAATDDSLALYYLYIQNVDTDQMAGRKLESALNVIFASLGNPLLEQEVRASMERKILKEGSLQERELKKFLGRTIPSKITEGVTVMRDGFFSNATSTRALVQPFENGETE